MHDFKPRQKLLCWRCNEVFAFNTKDLISNLMVVRFAATGGLSKLNREKNIDTTDRTSVFGLVVRFVQCGT